MNVGKSILLVCLFGIFNNLPVFAGVWVSSPSNGSTTGSPVHFVATAESPACAKGVAGIGIYTAPGKLAYVGNGASINTNLGMANGTYNVVVEEWDNCGWASTAPITLRVGGSSSSGSGGTTGSSGGGSSSSGSAGVTVSSPSNGSTTGSPVHFVATAQSPACARGVAAMGIYTAPGKLAYVGNGASMNTNLGMANGTYNVVVEEWDNCGRAVTAPITLRVGGSSSSGSGGTTGSSGGGSSSGSAGVTVSSPSNGSTTVSPVHFVATGQSPACAKGVAAMGIYTAPGRLAYVGNGASMNTSLSLANGTYNVVVEQWDNCGRAATSPITLRINGSSSSGSGGSSGGGSGGTSSGGGKVFSNLQKSGGWTGYALLPPAFGICSNCTAGGSQVKWWWNQGVSSTSMDGLTTQAYYGGGSTQWADILWNNHLIGDFSSQGLPDNGKTLVPSLHNFTYDVYFWVGNVNDSQALEFDINQFFGGKSFIWGHECRIDGGHEWDTWSNPGGHWVRSGIPCNPISNAWNHLTINVQRTSDGHLLFHTITLNGNTATLDRYDTPTSTNWYGVTVNYQQDGDYNKTPYSVYLDKLTFTAQ